MSKEIGNKAEAFVKEYLLNLGYKIKAQNVRYPFGEIDIVALDKEVLVFIEVKYRKSQSFSDACDAVTLSKQKKIIKAALTYLQAYSAKTPYCRFDVICVTNEMTKANIEHISDAFTA